mmetsp:Transcript_20191/g.42283  ORF Transcript_20191/g.42283 Transcript_20191/m.42283 type:complete len:494 (-) Transcript_20191:89-1570(-)
MASARDSLVALGGAALGAGALLLAQKSFDSDTFFGSGPSLVRKLSFKTPPCIVIIDPLSTGMTLASLLQSKGYACIRVYSQEFPDEIRNLVPKSLERPVGWHMTISHRGDVEETLKTIMMVKGVHVENFMVGCESGVELTDELTNLWVKKYASKNCPITTNGVAMSKARRDKYHMGEAVRSHGLRAVQQELFGEGKLEQVKKFVEGCKDDEGNFRVVLKPVASAGSEGVYFASTFSEVTNYYNEIIGSTNVFGHLNTSVLVQEFLAGKEYVVDSVSVEGVHKTVAIWEYDKRPANGAQFVYYGMRLYESGDGAREEELVKYMHGVLESLQVKNGPSHGEVMWTTKGPCLIEVGSRPHGGEGTFVTLADGCIGYNQLGVMVDAHENRSKFFNLPNRPDRLKGHSMEVCLINYHEGTLLGYPGMEEVKKMESYVESEMKMHVGEHFPVTVDFLTSPGAVMLMHESKEVMERDAERIHQLCKDGMFSTRRIRSDTL